MKRKRKSFQGGIMNKQEFIKRVMEVGNIEHKDHAERGVQIVFSILSHRIPKEESKDVASQLPSELKKVWNNNIWATTYFNLVGKKLKYRHLDEMLTLVDKELMRQNLQLGAENITKSVIHVLKEQISVGETNDVLANLPAEIRHFYEAA